MVRMTNTDTDTANTSVYFIQARFTIASFYSILMLSSVCVCARDGNFLSVTEFIFPAFPTVYPFSFVFVSLLSPHCAVCISMVL